MTKTLLPLLMIALLVLGCGTGSDSGASAGGESEPVSTAAEDSAADAAAPEEGGREAGTGEGPRARTEPRTRAVISTGTVELRSKDVSDARFDVIAVADRHEGEVSDEETATDDDGTLRRARLVLRVPGESFDEAMTSLAAVADLTSSTRSSEDVTTEVIDNDVRIRAQERSLRRIETLLARAGSLEEIVAVEAQLTQRQADLDSLKSQQAWLQDQTALSTITVHLEAAPSERTQPEEGEDRGFLAGLRDGWSGLSTLGTGAATALGLLLPFLVLAGALGVPTAVAARAAVRRRASTAQPQ